VTFVFYIGGADRYEYTVIGDPVNEAARLADLAKPDPQRVLAAEAIVTRARTSEASQWRLGEAVTLRGRPTPTRIAAPISQLRAPRAGSGRHDGSPTPPNNL
jgi:adenylate cyclase